MNKSACREAGHITVALSVYNGEATVELAVRSILSQSYRNFDLFIVDDGSTDKTFQILSSILPEDTRLHLVRLEKNVGTYSAKNLVLKRFCKGEFFAHQDADDVSWADRFRLQVEYLHNNPSIAACGTAIDEFYKDEEAGPSTQSDFEPEYNSEDGYYHRKNIYESLIDKGSCFQYKINNLAHIKIIMNGSALFRSAVLKHLGGYDGRTRVAGDTELLWRILTHHSVGNLEEVLYSRLFHAGSLTKSVNYGFGSSLRASYAEKITSKMMRLKKYYRSGQYSLLNNETKQDMHVADTHYEIFNGGHSL